MHLKAHNNVKKGLITNDIFNQKYALNRLEKINNADATVSVIWKSKSWVYTSAWKKSIHQGEEIADLNSLRLEALFI